MKKETVKMVLTTAVISLVVVFVYDMAKKKINEAKTSLPATTA